LRQHPVIKLLRPEGRPDIPEPPLRRNMEKQHEYAGAKTGKRLRAFLLFKSTAIDCLCLPPLNSQA
ncbi:hypothetical protein, partial [Streptomyces recifensis]|uniref:hypothetical protein n=1 Tax=Streptomyces recifensis TaxID=67355 RepID=UPI001ABF833C